MIRVLQVVTALDGGGVERMLFNYYRVMNRNQIQFDFIVHSEEKGLLEDHFIQMNSTIFRIPTRQQSLIKNFALTKRIIKRGNYDAIHVHLDMMSIIPLFLAMIFGIKIRIAHSHMATKPKGLLGRFKNKVFSFLIKAFANKLFACGIDAGISRYGLTTIKSNKVKVINNAIQISDYKFDESIRQVIRDEYQIENNEILIGHVGRFTQQKNHEFIINLFKKIYETNKRTKLMLVGNGELEDEIKLKVEKMGLGNNIIFCGIRDDVNKLMQAMDILILPSKYEGLPVVLVEAQCSGLSCLVSDTITKEVNVTGRIKYLSLNSEIKDWVNTAFEMLKTNNRLNNKSYVDIKNAGYDIEIEKIHLENSYKFSN